MVFEKGEYGDPEIVVAKGESQRELAQEDEVGPLEKGAAYLIQTDPQGVLVSGAKELLFKYGTWKKIPEDACEKFVVTDKRGYDYLMVKAIAKKMEEEGGK